jgi:hypothetical protein
MKVTDQMIYAFAGDPEITVTDAHAIKVGLQAALDLLEPFVSAAAKHVCSDEVDDWNDACDAWDKLPAAIQHALVDEA